MKMIRVIRMRCIEIDSVKTRANRFDAISRSKSLFLYRNIESDMSAVYLSNDYMFELCFFFFIFRKPIKLDEK